MRAGIRAPGIAPGTPRSAVGWPAQVRVADPAGTPAGMRLGPGLSQLREPTNQAWIREWGCEAVQLYASRLASMGPQALSWATPLAGCTARQGQARVADPAGRHAAGNAAWDWSSTAFQGMPYCCKRAPTASRLVQLPVHAHVADPAGRHAAGGNAAWDWARSHSQGDTSWYRYAGRTGIRAPRHCAWDPLVWLCGGRPRFGSQTPRADMLRICGLGLGLPARGTHKLGWGVSQQPTRGSSRVPAWG